MYQNTVYTGLECIYCLTQLYGGYIYIYIYILLYREQLHVSALDNVLPYTVFDENIRRREGWGRGGGRRKCIHVGSQTSLSSRLHSVEKRYVAKSRPTLCWTGYVLTQGKTFQ